MLETPTPRLDGRANDGRKKVVAAGRWLHRARAPANMSGWASTHHRHDSRSRCADKESALESVAVGKAFVGEALSVAKSATGRLPFCYRLPT